ncbi:hypothetical protein GC173_15890 [bacterium]|nr:hypothetical protein [bacterium]
MTRFLNLTFARFVRVVTLMVIFAVLILVGLDLLFATETVRSYFPDVVWEPATKMDEVVLLAFGALCFLLPPFYIALTMLNRRIERGIVGRGTNGKYISLDSEAVSRTITREVRSQVEEVIRVRSCETWQGWGAPKVIIRISISDRAPVPAVQEKVREVVVSVLTQLIGYADGEQVKVRVREIAGATAPRRRPRSPRKSDDNGKTQELVTTP